MCSTSELQKLTGKVALFTGGSRGIGAVIAKWLAQDGAVVAITYSSSPQKAEEVVSAIQSAGGKALAIQGDSASVEAVKNAVAATVKAFGGLHILLNNAGVGIVAPIDQFSLEDFDRSIAVNVRAAFVAAKEASRYLKDGGRIISIGSVNGDLVPFAGGSVYAITKAAVAGFARGLSRDLGPRGITVNNVQPGPVDTDMNPAVGLFADAARGMISLGRYGSGDEIASLVAFLASPEASFITGASLDADGGYNA